MRIEACWCEQDQSAAAAKHLHPSGAGADAFQLLISVTSRCTARVLWCCPAQQRGDETERAAGAAGLGKVTYTQTGTSPVPGSHLSLAKSACKLDHVFTLFCDMQKMHHYTWSVCRQTHPLYLKVKAAHSYICVGLGFCANAALFHHYGSPVENGLEKVVIP